MLGFKKTKQDAVSGFLGSQTEFVGKLAFSGVVHLDGVFHGEIISRGTLVVGSESVVNATIHSAVLKIAGEVHGDITATEKIELYPPAKVYGHIQTPKLMVEEGVIFEGTCSMSSTKIETKEIESTIDHPVDDDDTISARAWTEYEEAISLEEVEKGGLHKS
jgi:cytoskeletal protein CcmA (bactofilin family)